MPNVTPVYPHALTCIKWAMRDLLRAQVYDDLTISCDRADCWNDSELFKWRQAVNISFQGDQIFGAVKTPRQKHRMGSTAAQAEIPNCVRDAQATYAVEIYIQDCMDCRDDDCDCLNASDKALAILGTIQRIFALNPDQIPGRAIEYLGSNLAIDDETNVKLAVLTATFQVKYYLDQSAPLQGEQETTTPEE